MRVVFLFLVTVFPHFLFSQCWTYYNTSNSGLPWDIIRDFAIDTNTNDIWIATQTGGLAKFDGFNWTVYNSSNSPLPENIITSLAIDDFGILWIGTKVSGIVEFDGTNWTIYNGTNTNSFGGYGSNGITDIEVDNQNYIWAATNTGAVKFDRADWYSYSTVNSPIPADYVTSVKVDAQNNVWFGTSFYTPSQTPGGGIAKFDGITWSIFDTSNSGLLDNNILDLEVDVQGNIWISARNQSTTDGLPIMKFDGQNWTYFDSLTTGLFGASDIMIDNYGTVWFAEIQTSWRPWNKLVRFDGINWPAIYTNFPNGAGIWGAMATDENGSIWLGSEGDGLAKYSCNTPPPLRDYTLSGVVFIDDNQNGIKDAVEGGLQREIVKMLNAPSVYTPTDLNSRYNFVIDTGTYSVLYLPKEYWSPTTPTTRTTTVTTGNYQTTGLDFGIHPRADKQDVAVYLAGGLTRCAAIVNYRIDYINLATKTVNGSVIFEFDESFLDYVVSYPTADSVASNRVVLNYSNLQPFEQRQFLVKVKVIGTAIGFPIRTSAEIQPFAGDLRTENNVDSGLVQILRCSIDPNDKLVKPEGVGDDKLTLFGQELVYTVRFQNTGNDTAFNVTIEDTLDQNLEVQTFKFIGSSHTADFDIKGSGIVTFTFNNIMLPDSNVDYAGSQGYVKYSIYSKDSLPENTVISNRAAIIFDSNPPVITNTVFNTLVSSIPTTTGTISNKTAIQIFPNPSENSIELVYNPNNVIIKTIEIYTLQGKMVKAFANPRTLNISELPSGLYFLTIKDEVGKILKVEKLIKQ